MRQPLYLLTLLALFSCESWKYPDNPSPLKGIEKPLESFELQGEVEKVKEVAFNTDGSVLSEKYWVFNTDGMLLEESQRYGQDIEPSRRYTYREDGQLQEVYERRIREKKNFMGSSRKVFMGLLIKSIYHPDGRLVGVETYNNEGKKVKGETFTFNDDGSLKYIDTDGDQSARVAFEMEEDGNMAKKRGKGWYYTYEYDGATVTERLFSNDRQANMKTAKYDSQYLVEETSYRMGEDSTWKPEEVSIVQRDSYHNPVLVTVSKDGKEAKKYSFSYTYDGDGNWIEKTEYNQGEPYRLYQREITYRRRRFLGIIPSL